jgi:hypothetical protein
MRPRVNPSEAASTGIILLWHGVNELFAGDQMMPMWTALKGLSQEIYMVIFWLEWIYLGLNGNHFFI